MANFDNNFRTGYIVRISYTINSQNVANNTTNVTVEARLVSTGSDYYMTSSTGNNRDGVLTINGTEYAFKFGITLSGNQNKLLHSVTVDIPHNADGTKKCAMSLSLPLNVTLTDKYWGTVSTSGTATFDTIARKSTISSISGSTIGSTMTVNINKASSNFTTTVWIHVPGYNWYYMVGKSTETSISFTIPNDLANQIPNATSIGARVIIRTFNGTTELGDDSWDRTIHVPSSMTPSISSVQLSADTSINGQSVYIKDKSKLRAITSASGTYSSWITDIRVDYDNASYWGSNITTNILRNSETRSVKVTVTDSRGRTAVWNGSIYVCPYSNPWGSIKAYRCDSSGVRDDVSGTYVKVEFSADKSSINGANTITVAIDHRETGYEWSPNDYSSSQSINSSYVVLGSSDSLYDLDKTYDVRLKVSDYYTTTYYIVSISTASVFLDFRAGGTGLGIGRLCTEDHTVQTDKVVQIFSGRGGDPYKGADLNFCNVSKDSQRIGWCGGVPVSDNLILLHRFTETEGNVAGDLIRITTDNKCYNNFALNYFANDIRFYKSSVSSLDYGVIRYDGSQTYFYCQNPATNHNLGCWSDSDGAIWYYSASSAQLLLKSGFATTSDRRLKYDFNEFENWDNYYNFFMSLKPQTFKYNNDVRKETFIGMVAQDVADSIVENGLNNEKLCIVKCAENDAMEDGREYSLAYQEFIALNVKMIQKQEKEILELKEIIEEQQRLIEELLQEEI